MKLDDVYTEIPDDPPLAFAHMEDSYRKQLDKALAELDERNDGRMHFIRYMNRTIAAADILGIDQIKSWRAPSIDEEQVSIIYNNFVIEVENYIEKIKIVHSRRQRKYSVSLDTKTKEKIRHHISQVRGIVDKLDIDEKKRSSLYDKLSALESEVNRTISRFDVYASMAIEVASVGGDMGRKLGPVKKIIDSIGTLLGKAKETENSTPYLPPPESRRQIEGPRKQLPAPPVDEMSEGMSETPS